MANATRVSFLALLVGCAALRGAEPDINIDFPAKVTSLVYAKAVFGNAQVKLPIVNGLIPDQMVEGYEAGVLTQRNFSYKDKVVWDRRAYYSYSGPVKGPTITEETDGIKKAYATQVYTLRKMP